MDDIQPVANHSGSITNSDLELATLLMLFVIIESIAGPLEGKHIALYSDNSSSVQWVQHLASRNSLATRQLIQALALHLQVTKSSQLTPLHIPGKSNAMANIPSSSFGNPARWGCTSDYAFLTLYKSCFPFP